MSDKGLLQIAQRLVVDRDFRERFLIAPAAVLADLGVSAEAYQALMAVVPILLAGGIGIIGLVLAERSVTPDALGWGRGMA